MHESFMLVHKNIKASKKGSAKYHDSNAQNVNLKVGDPVFLKQNIRKSKLDRKWVPFWRIVEQKSPLIYVVMNQLDGTIRETHARHIRLANVDEWHPTKKDFERQKRKARLIISPDVSDSGSESNDKNPLKHLVNKNKGHRSGSSSVDDIPLLELKKRLKAKKRNDERRSSNKECSPGSSTCRWNS